VPRVTSELISFDAGLLEFLLQQLDLVGHSHNHVDTGEVDSEVVDEARDGAQALDIFVGKEASVAGCTMGRHEADPFVRADGLLVEADHSSDD
jgi:hypothetical protein